MTTKQECCERCDSRKIKKIILSSKGKEPPGIPFCAIEDCPCHATPPQENYERRSHVHCWNQKEPACGINLANHKQCCLCDATPPPTEGKVEVKACKHCMRILEANGAPLYCQNSHCEYAKDDDGCQGAAPTSEGWKERVNKLRDMVVGAINSQNDKRAIRNLLDSTLPSFIESELQKARQEQSVADLALEERAYKEGEKDARTATLHDLQKKIEGRRKNSPNIHVGNDTGKAHDLGKIYGYNQAVDDLSADISALLEEDNK